MAPPSDPKLQWNAVIYMWCRSKVMLRRLIGVPLRTSRAIRKVVRRAARQHYDQLGMKERKKRLYLCLYIEDIAI